MDRSTGPTTSSADPANGARFFAVNASDRLEGGRIHIVPVDFVVNRSITSASQGTRRQAIPHRRSGADACPAMCLNHVRHAAQTLRPHDVRSWALFGFVSTQPEEGRDGADAVPLHSQRGYAGPGTAARNDVVRQLPDALRLPAKSLSGRTQPWAFRARRPPATSTSPLRSRGDVARTPPCGCCSPA